LHPTTAINTYRVQDGCYILECRSSLINVFYFFFRQLWNVTTNIYIYIYIANISWFIIQSKILPSSPALSILVLHLSFYLEWTLSRLLFLFFYSFFNYIKNKFYIRFSTSHEKRSPIFFLYKIVSLIDWKANWYLYQRFIEGCKWQKPLAWWSTTVRVTNRKALLYFPMCPRFISWAAHYQECGGGRNLWYVHSFCLLGKMSTFIILK